MRERESWQAPSSLAGYERRLGAAGRDAVVLTFFTPADEEMAAQLNVPPIPDVLF